MKKITFYKSLRNGEIEQCTGYLYEAKNGVKVALYKSDLWYATEITTGCDCGAYAYSRAYCIEIIEQRADKIAHILKSVDCSKYIKRIAEAMGIPA